MCSRDREMPSVTIPLVGSYNQRNLNGRDTLVAGKDQRFRGCFFEVIRNPATGKGTVYVEKRPGFSSLYTPVASGLASAISDDGVVTVWQDGANLRVMSGSGTSCGIITSGLAPFTIRKVRMNNENFYVMGGVAEGWYVPVTAVPLSTTFTADTTSGSAVLANVSSTSGLYIGQLLSGTGIAATARIKTIDSATQVTMTVNATATNATVTITREHLAKIIDTDFPNAAGGFVELDGYLFQMDLNGNVYNSDLNSITSWGASSYINASMRPNTGIGLARHKDLILAFGQDGIDVYRNAGNPTGSPLVRAGGFRGIGTNSWSATTYRSIDFLGEHVVWLGGEGVSSAGGKTGVWMFVDGVPRKISTPAIEKILFGGDGQSLAAVGLFEIQYGKYVNVVGYLENTNLLYDIKNGIWMESNFPSGFRLASESLYAVDVDTASGKVYRINYLADPVFQDDGAAYSAIIQTSRVNHGTEKRKYVRSVSLIGDEQASGTATLEASDDDYGTWVTLGTFDMTKHEKKITRCGSHKGGRAYRLTHSANTAFRAEALQVDFDMGLH